MDAFQAIRQTIKEDFNVQQLPSVLDEFIQLLTKTRIYYCAFKRYQFIKKAAKEPNRGNSIAYGAALHFIGDYQALAAYAIRVALITKCTEDLLREYRQLNQDYHSLCQTYKWQYPLYQKIEWKQRDNKIYSTLSPSFSLLCQIYLTNLIKQILKIHRLILQVLWQSFKLSMSLCDAYLILNNDSQTRLEACTELVAEWDQYRNQLKEDRKRLQEEIQKGSELADRLLQRLDPTKNSSFILKTLKEKIEKIGDQTQGLLENVCDVHEEAIDTLYVKGKITPLHLDLAQGKAAIPTLPYDRFPPWAGQNVTLIASKPIPSPLKPIEQILLDQIKLSLGSSFKSLSKLVGQIQ